METPATKPVGRPKGTAKTGGRKPGAVNRPPDELRRFINHRGRPLELLAAIADGRKVSAANPEKPGEIIRVYPSLNERVSAARTLLNKLLPDLKSSELTGPDGAALDLGQQSMSPFELARRIAFTLAQGIQAAEDEMLQPVRYLPPAPDDGQDAAPSPEVVSPQPIVTPDRSAWIVDGLTISFAEPLGSDRERWVIRDQLGRIAGSAIGRAAAADMARRLGGGK